MLAALRDRRRSFLCCGVDCGGGAFSFFGLVGVPENDHNSGEIRFKKKLNESKVSLR